MNDSELVVIDNISPEEAAQQVPVIISNSMNSLKNIQAKIQETKQMAEDAKEQAESAWLVDVGFWRRTTPALEALQRAGKCQSEAVVGISECQELLFKQQCVLAQCTKYLFMLCCANLASARIAVQEIQASLQGASQEEISDIAKNELQKTMQQLKQQIDILEQQERLKNKVSKLDVELQRKEEEIELQKNRVENLENKLTSYNSTIVQQNNRLDSFRETLLTTENNLKSKSDSIISEQESFEKKLTSDFEKMNQNSKEQMDVFFEEYKQKILELENNTLSKRLAKLQRFVVFFSLFFLLVCGSAIFFYVKMCR